MGLHAERGFLPRAAYRGSYPVYLVRQGEPLSRVGRNAVTSNAPCTLHPACGSGSLISGITKEQIEPQVNSLNTDSQSQKRGLAASMMEKALPRGFQLVLDMLSLFALAQL